MSNLPNHVFDACDDIDATVFTGDLFYDDKDALDEFEMYVALVQRGIASIRQFHIDEASVPLEDDE